MSSGGPISEELISCGPMSVDFISEEFISVDFISEEFISVDFISPEIMSEGLMSCGPMSGGFISGGFISAGGGPMSAAPVTAVIFGCDESSREQDSGASSAMTTIAARRGECGVFMVDSLLKAMDRKRSPTANLESRLGCNTARNTAAESR
jgi:hypothetical protein